MTRFLSEKVDLDVEKAVTAIAAYRTLPEAVDYLASEGITTTESKLKVWRDTMYADRVRKRREQIAPLIEEKLASDLLGNATLASDVTALAIQKTREMLEDGKIADPSRVARDLSQVGTQAVDKRLALQGRPTQITEHRDVSEIIRALEGMKVVVSSVDSTAIEETVG
ncbi:MAG TPA: hypothetical protein VK730_13680 [Solirubrobacteraceae bacterium]|jgi:hypothetical protein|nr:hypothetical protein [Solirubrobacteraceae bacterium]